MSEPKGHLFYEMQRLTAIAEDLVAHVEEMREHCAAIMEYCTGECHDCPIREICDWDRNITYEESDATSIELMVDFVDFAHEHEEDEPSDFDGWYDPDDEL